MFDTSRTTIALARKERRSGNLPEVLLWRALRTRPDDFKFRRQHPIGPYSLDFACLSARLAIEVDGEAHNRGARPARDEARDDHLVSLGFRSLRIPARDILSDLDTVLRAIISACEGGQPLHHSPSASGPPPRSGEVFGQDIPS